MERVRGIERDLDNSLITWLIDRVRIPRLRASHVFHCG